MERRWLLERIELVDKRCYKCEKYTASGEKYLKLGNYYWFLDSTFYGDIKVPLLRWERLCENCFCCLQCGLKLVNIYYKSDVGEVFCSNCVSELQLELQKNFADYYSREKIRIANDYYYFEEDSEIKTCENFHKKRINKKFSKTKLDQETIQRAKDLFWHWN